MSSSRSLYRLIKDETGLDVRKCQACMDCECACPEEQDIPLGSVVQMILLNDEEVLTCRTVWSDKVLQASPSACKRGLNLTIILLTLRQEAVQRGLMAQREHPPVE